MDARPAIDAAAEAGRTGGFVGVVPYGRVSESSDPNEFVLFFKPEITISSEKLAAVWELVERQLARFDCRIVATAAAGARYLQRHQTFEQHYGVINQIAHHGLTAITATARTKIEALLEQEGTDIEVLGAYPFLRRFPDYTAASLAALHDSKPLHRFGGGTNGVLVSVGGRRILLLNGFHPYQIEEYYSEGRSILNLVVRSSFPWKTLRRDLIGATNPSRAEPSSIRGLLLAQKDSIGLPDVSPMHNGVHASAGPIEAIVEIGRFMSDLDHGSRLEPEDTTLGCAITQVVGADLLHTLCSNALVQYGEMREPAFDLTEEWDASELLQRVSARAIVPVERRQ